MKIIITFIFSALLSTELIAQNVTNQTVTEKQWSTIDGTYTTFFDPQGLKYYLQLDGVNDGRLPEFFAQYRENITSACGAKVSSLMRPGDISEVVSTYTQKSSNYHFVHSQPVITYSIRALARPGDGPKRIASFDECVSNAVVALAEKFKLDFEDAHDYSNFFAAIFVPTSVVCALCCIAGILFFLNPANSLHRGIFRQRPRSYENSGTIELGKISGMLEQRRAALGTVAQ